MARTRIKIRLGITSGGKVNLDNLAVAGGSGLDGASECVGWGDWDFVTSCLDYVHVV